MEVTNVEQRAYIKIAIFQERNAMECHNKLVEALGNNALPYRTVAWCIGKFQQGHVSPSDEQRLARPVSVTKFEETRSLNVRSGRGRKPVSAEAIEKVALQVEDDNASNVQASTSVRLVAEALDLPRSTVQKIMRNILRYYPYKLQLVHELLPHDFETRHLFSLQFLARLEVDPEWPWNILWTHEAHFHLDGSVNTHNCRIWESDNPHSTFQVPLHSPKVMV
ncbi:uncharacterized protein TNCV_4226081 [Trichonephila clavipes]|uniref:Mos1 transposase HTH domain-containing protein n=1 Tax=Trichonephila clavipes TaxID=2585209 RepID=A0A8X6SSK7_TRICX|nr:uncharacterized protein TNCV_4226081 [Trichonephila clavipes]